jgi:hypothetical protein
MKLTSVSTVFTTTLFATAFAVTTLVYSTHNNSSATVKTIDLGAFVNLQRNISALGETKIISPMDESHLLRKEELVISSIDKELTKTINDRKKIFKKKTNTNKAIIAFKKSNKIKSKNIINDEVQSVQSSIVKIKQSEDLSKYEINNKELVYLSSYSLENSEIVSNTKFDYSSIDEINNEQKFEKEVKKVIGSIEPVESKNTNDDNDLKVFDYPQAEVKTKTNAKKLALKPNGIAKQEIDKKLYERPLSDTVKKAISREIGNYKKISTEAKNTYLNDENVDTQNSFDDSNTDDTSEALKNIQMSTQASNESKSNIEEDQLSFDYSALKKPTTNVVTTQASLEKSAFAASKPQVTTQIKMRTLEVNMSTQKNKAGSSFEFIPDFDRNERSYDSNTGELALEYSNNNDSQTLTGVVSKNGFVPTRIDLLMSSHQLVVPTFEEKNYQMFLEKNEISKTNAIVISLPENVSDVEIDSEYEKKMSLDKKFKETANNRQFIMFLGVKSGNILLKYRLEDNSTAQKIIYLGEEEIFFEEPVVENGKRESFELNTRSLMSTKIKELNISSSDVRVFNTNITAKKSALNVYELKMPSMLLGSRKYLEVKYQGNSVFVGTQNDKKIEIPQIDFIKKVLEFNQVSSLDERCLVQVNLTKEVSDIKTAGKNATGDMFVETSFLDVEGKMNKEGPELAEKLFIMGEQEGIMSLFVNYTDGTSEALKTFCSNNTFLVEQL